MKLEMEEVNNSEEVREPLTKESALKKVEDAEIEHWSTYLGDGNHSLGKDVLEGKDASYLAKLVNLLPIRPKESGQNYFVDTDPQKFDFITSFNLFKKDDIIQLSGGEEQFNNLCKQSYDKYRREGSFEPTGSIPLTENGDININFQIWNNSRYGEKDNFEVGYTHVRMPLASENKPNGYDLINKGLDNWRNSIKQNQPQTIQP